MTSTHEKEVLEKPFRDKIADRLVGVNHIRKKRIPDLLIDFIKECSLMLPCDIIYVKEYCMILMLYIKRNFINSTKFYTKITDVVYKNNLYKVMRKDIDKFDGTYNEMQDKLFSLEYFISSMRLETVNQTIDEVKKLGESLDELYNIYWSINNFTYRIYWHDDKQRTESRIKI